MAKDADELRRRAERRRIERQTPAQSLHPRQHLIDANLLPNLITFLPASAFVTHLRALCLAMFNRNYRGEPQQRTFGAVHGYLDFTSLLTALGSIVELRLGMMQHYLMLPLPSEVIFALEEERLRLLGVIRTTLGNTTQYMQYFSVKPVAGLPVLKTTQDADQQQPALVTLINLLLMYIRHHYDLPALPPAGYDRGRMHENTNFALRCPERTQWSQYLLDWLQRFAIPIADFGGFALPTGGVQRGPATDKKRRSQPPRYDLSRLLFYMSLSPYQEPRSLEGENPNHYQVISFGNKTIIDTPWTNNAMFCFDASLDVCMRLAGGNKDALRTHPLCARRITHQGDWTLAVRTWLGC